ncbi:hypothetical protein SAMD00019534_122820, partial [Acytostelium subglobosum LB1]|uniref:hypothetical protein n=1 Tax=Acytostelium subglobosum LB1 TaxID=1410327 RepID=UPI0006449A21
MPTTATSTTDSGTSTTSMPTTGTSTTTGTTGTSTTSMPTTGTSTTTGTTGTSTTSMPTTATSATTGTTGTSTTSMPSTGTTSVPTSTSTTSMPTTGTTTSMPTSTSTTSLPTATPTSTVIGTDFNAIKVQRKYLGTTVSSPYTLDTLQTLDISLVPLNNAVFILNQLNSAGLSSIKLSYTASSPLAFTADLVTAFPNLVSLNLTGNVISGELPVSMFKHSKLQTLELSGNTVATNNIDFGSALGNILTQMSLIISKDATFATQALPKMKALTLYFSQARVLNVNLNNLQSLTLKGSPAKPNVNLGFTCQSLTSLSISSSNPIVNSDLRACTNLTDVSLNSNAARTSLLFVQYPPSLINYAETQTSITGSLPTDIKNITTLRLVGDQLNVNAATIKYTKLQLLDLSSNNIAGTTQPELCTNWKVNLKSNPLTDVADCFKCYYAYTKDWLPTISNTTGSNCALINNMYSGYPVSNGGIVTIQGQNLGWGGSDASKELTVIVPNTLFSYRAPAQSSVGTIIQTVSFATTIAKDITLIYKTITGVTFDQQPSGVNVTIQGLNLITSTFKVGGLTCTVSVQTNETVVCLVSSALVEGDVLIVASDNVFGDTSVTRGYIHRYPLVRSISLIGQDGGQVSFYGNFSARSGSITNITVDGVNCPTVSVASDLLVCTLAPTKSVGTVNLNITNDGYRFDTPLLFHITPGSLQCPDGCGPGTCVMGICQCPADSYGPKCAYKLPTETAHRNDNDTAPGTTYLYKEVQYEFIVRAIQEVDSELQIVHEELLGGWSLTTSDTDTLLSNSYALSNVNGASITATMEVNKVPRTVSFAGITRDHSAYTVKGSLKISGWQFRKSTNIIRVVVATSSALTHNADTCGEESQNLGVDELNNLNYLLLERNGVAFYGRFMNRSLSDGRPTFSATTLLNQTLQADGTNVTYVGVSLPQCAECILDPDFSVLVNPEVNLNNPCNRDKSSKSWIVPVAVVVPLVVLCSLAIAGFFFLKRHYYITHEGIRIKFTSRRMSSRKMSLRKIFVRS